ncbi:hypothetical protein LUZ60_011786 [Juncus effusus]|nr:hypothetical protein LUZ60_011786 [Juncus effusus]
MGVGGNFWDLLKPCARHEGVDWLRGKRVAVDLPFWIVQHDAAIRARLPRARNPHLRTTFFRTLALFSKMGAFPVFVVDGTPSPMKSQARIERFFRSSGLDPSELPSPLMASEGERETNSVKRNPVFARYIQQCIELLELLGIPVLKAESEAEALCAQLNYEGHVDACITSDSDTFLFGAKCVIKSFNSNSKEPFECYYLSDIESKIGLKRNKMIAIALLAGNDHALNGVPGFGSENSLRLVRLFNEHEIFDRLREIGEGNFPLLEKAKDDESDNFANETLKSLRITHCSNCGHPGSKKTHRNVACEYCFVNNDNKLEFCVEKPNGFKCICPSCDEERKFKEKKRQENWQIKFFEKIASEKSFPNEEIINLYLKENHGDYKENGGPNLKWENPKIEELIDFLNYHQNWNPSYIRQRIFPMLTTIYLRKISLNNNNNNNSSLIYDQFEFDSVKRVKIRCGHPYYLVKWKKNGSKKFVNNSEEEITDLDINEHNGSDPDLFNELDPIEINENEGIILTEENMELVRAAFPLEIERLEKEQKLKERKSNKSSGSTQLNITEFFKSTKARANGDSSSIGEVQKLKRGKEKAAIDLDKNLPKSVRRKLLFD